MKAFKIPENRGRASKITMEMVRIIIRAAEKIRQQGKRLRIGKFTHELRDKDDRAFISVFERKYQMAFLASMAAR
jgi:predicted O-linked N-acetylglucosamine transferase (SPINDLY family)